MRKKFNGYYTKLHYEIWCKAWDNHFLYIDSFFNYKIKFENQNKSLSNKRGESVVAKKLKNSFVIPTFFLTLHSQNGISREA